MLLLWILMVLVALSVNIGYPSALKVTGGAADPSLSPSLENAIGRSLRQDRLRRGQTMRQTADNAHISIRTLSRYESGRLPDETMDVAILQQLGLTLTGSPDAYLTPYHRWVRDNAASDVAWLLASRHYPNIEALARACGTTHRTLYAWAQGRGRPSERIWRVILAEKTRSP